MCSQLMWIALGKPKMPKLYILINPGQYFLLSTFHKHLFVIWSFISLKCVHLNHFPLLFNYVKGFCHLEQMTVAMATVYNVHFYFGQNELVWAPPPSLHCIWDEKPNNLIHTLWFLTGLYTTISLYLHLHLSALCQQTSENCVNVLCVYITSAGAYCCGIIGRKKCIWSKWNSC